MEDCLRKHKMAFFSKLMGQQRNYAYFLMEKIRISFSLSKKSSQNYLRGREIDILYLGDISDLRQLDFWEKNIISSRFFLLK